MKAAQSYNLCIELLSKRVDDTGAKPGLWLGKDALRFADPIVSDRKLPIRSGNIECDGDLPVFCIFAECMLYRIDNELRDDQSEALGFTARRASFLAMHLQRN